MAAAAAAATTGASSGAAASAAGCARGHDARRPRHRRHLRREPPAAGFLPLCTHHPWDPEASGNCIRDCVHRLRRPCLSRRHPLVSLCHRHRDAGHFPLDYRLPLCHKRGHHTTLVYDCKYNYLFSKFYC